MSTIPPAPAIQPAVTIEEISDPTVTRAGMDLIDQDAVQLQSLPLRLRRVSVRLEAAAVVYHSSNQRARRWYGEWPAHPSRPDALIA